MSVLDSIASMPMLTSGMDAAEKQEDNTLLIS
jgi:hypothetical protein